MIPKGEIIFNPSEKTGFQAKFSNPIFQRLFLDRLESSFPNVNFQQEERAPPQNPDTKNDTQKLNELVAGTRKPLLKIRTVIPFNPFPDELVVDINKVTIVFRQFFASSQEHSVLIKDISDIVVETSLIFATLKIIDIGYTDNSIDINYLSKKGAIKAKSIIQGLVVAHKYGVDLSKVADEDLYGKIEYLGSTENK